MSASGPFEPPGAATPTPYAPPAQTLDAPGLRAPQVPSPGRDYELGADENRVIAGAALWARVLGGMLIFQSVLWLVQLNVVGAALDVVLGALLFYAGNSFDAVVKTEGNDVADLMQALSRLGTVFKIRVALTMMVMGLVMLVVFCFLALLFLARMWRGLLS